MWTPNQSSFSLLLLLFVFSFLFPGAEAEARRGGGRRRDREGKLREFVTYYTLLRKLNTFRGYSITITFFLFGQSPFSRSFGKTIALIKNMPSLPLFEETNYFFVPPWSKTALEAIFQGSPTTSAPAPAAWTAPATLRRSAPTVAAPTEELAHLVLVSAVWVSRRTDYAWATENLNNFFFEVTLSCGGMSSENCTYFNSVNVMAGGCQATICPCNDNICQVEKVQHVKLQNRHVLICFATVETRLPVLFHHGTNHQYCNCDQAPGQDRCGHKQWHSWAEWVHPVPDRHVQCVQLRWTKPASNLWSEHWRTQ